MMQFILIIFKAKMHLPPEGSSSGDWLRQANFCLWVGLAGSWESSWPYSSLPPASIHRQRQILEHCSTKPLRWCVPVQAACSRLPAILLCGASNLWPAPAGRSNYFAFCILFSVQASFSKKDAELSSNIVQDACGRRFLQKSDSFKASAFQISASL